MPGGAQSKRPTAKHAAPRAPHPRRLLTDDERDAGAVCRRGHAVAILAHHVHRHVLRGRCVACRRRGWRCACLTSRHTTPIPATRSPRTLIGIQLPSKCRLMAAPMRSDPDAAEENCTNDRRRSAGATLRLSLAPLSRQYTGERAEPSCRGWGRCATVVRGRLSRQRRTSVCPQGNVPPRASSSYSHARPTSSTP